MSSTARIPSPTIWPQSPHSHSLFNTASQQLRQRENKIPILDRKKKWSFCFVLEFGWSVDWFPQWLYCWLSHISQEPHWGQCPAQHGVILNSRVTCLHVFVSFYIWFFLTLSADPFHSFSFHFSPPTPATLLFQSNSSTHTFDNLGDSLR